MAIIEHPVPDEDRKDMGNLECYTDKFGHIILRSKPIFRTPAQKAYSQGFKRLTKLLSQVLDNINEAYCGMLKDTYAFRHVLTINLKKCFVAKSYAIDPSLLVLCENNGSFVENITLNSTVANAITVTFNSNAQNPEEGADPVKAFGFNVKGNQIWQFDQSAIRSTGTMTLTRPGMSSLNIAVYLECLDRVNLFNNSPKHVIKYVGTVKVL
jgi:hypothetical protein